MSLLVVVHLCPQVPTAPNKEPITVIFKSALGVTIIALFPPSSYKLFPNLLATVEPTILPILVEPVADIRGIRSSVVKYSPTS